MASGVNESHAQSSLLPMKRALLFAFLLPAIAWAQSPPGVPVLPRPAAIPVQVRFSGADALPDHYQIGLSINAKDGASTELSIVVASSQFSIKFGEQGISLAGTITVEDAGTVLVAYSLGW